MPGIINPAEGIRVNLTNVKGWHNIPLRSIITEQTGLVCSLENDAKAMAYYGEVFVEAGRENNIDAALLAAISAHESGAWKSAAARFKNNWMGLMTRFGAKRFANKEQSIFFVAELLNRRPFKGQKTLLELASVYCATNPSYWRRCVPEWERLLSGSDRAQVVSVR